MDNYVVYHLHSDLSNGVTNVDSVTKYGEYIQVAKECGMKAMAFSEHGSIFEWFHKKSEIEAAGMKYIHAIEAYLTYSTEEKVRDNYHCVLIARNYDGFLELNSLISKSFNRKDGHFYYVPRITFKELFNTSNNIIVTSACIGGVLGKTEQYIGTEKQYIRDEFLQFLTENKERCFLEVGHHMDEKQILYNKELYELSKQTGLKLIAGTDTHVLNEEHEMGRTILQKAKNIHFSDEDMWDLKFKTLDELLEAYKKQGSLPEEVYIQAIDNTNLLANMVEEFSLDTNTKYPHIYDNPEQVFRKKILDSMHSHPYALKNHTEEELLAVIDEEFEVYKATGSIDFMLMQTYLREWEQKNGIQCGYGRGSVSGSMIAYLLGVTQMDSMRFGLNFFRFLNPSRVTNCDIDTDYSGKDRDRVKELLLKDKMGLENINSAEIITFNTIAMKGAIRDVCRALYKESKPDEYISIADTIVKLAESDENLARKKYPDVFKYVDIVNGTIVSIGTHPSGVLISDLPIEQEVGLCSIATSEYPVSMINMKELDALFFVKLDLLGLDNIGVINDTCKALGIERLTPDNVDLEDKKVWDSIRDDTTLIFQWESASAQQYLKKFMSEETLKIAREKIHDFSMLKWMSFGNGLLRPACASFRDSVARGEFYDNGFDALNEFLAPEAGRIAMQETIMQFLVKFCGYSAAESDNVRRAIAKKKGTETLLPEIKQRFIDFASKEYDMAEEKCAEVIEPFIQIILDASSYAFSWNHSDAYSCIGYISGYLRYYHPFEFITSALNIFDDNTEKTAEITKYATKNGIKVVSPKWGVSKGKYFYDSEKRVIAKGLGSVKFMNETVADNLYEVSQSEYNDFTDVLLMLDGTGINRRQLDILIRIDFFSEFGNQKELLTIVDAYYDIFKRGTAKQISKNKIDGTPLESVIQEYSVGTTKSGGVAKNYTMLDIDSAMHDAEAAVLNSSLPDLEDSVKIKAFAEYMGYIGYSSGKEEDRRKLYLLDIKPIKRKKDGKKIGYSFVTKSLGSGIESRFTVWNATFNRAPAKKGDIIYCKRWSKDGAYFTLEDYCMVN